MKSPIIHLPNTKEGKELLSRKICQAPLSMVATNINKLNIPFSQKIALFEAVCDEIEKNSKTK